jgi:hypothetical protein
MRRIREKEGMFERLKSKTALALIAAAIAALGVGGVAVAQNASTGSSQHSATQSAAGDLETNDQPGDDGASEGADKGTEHSSGKEKEDPGTDQGEQ